METTDNDWGRIYPNIITWIAGAKGEDKGTYYQLTWVRFWREGSEYQLPVRMEVAGIETLEEGGKYDEQFHKRCLDIIRYGKATGDFKEPIKFNDKHVITISKYEDIIDHNNEQEETESTVE